VSLYTNRWAGLTLERPDGFAISVQQGVVLAKKDPVGATCAIIFPVRGPTASSPDALASSFIATARSQNPSIVAFRAPGTNGDGVILRTRGVFLGRPTEGTFHVRAAGGSGVVTGFQAPKESFTAIAPVVSAMLASVKATAALPRWQFRDPTEGAFTALVPEGFRAKGGVTRNNAFGMPTIGFEASDPTGALHAGIPPGSIDFAEPVTAMGVLGSLFGMGMPVMPAPGGQTSPYLLAPVFARQWLAPRVPLKGARIESVDDRPDLIPYLLGEVRRGGFTGAVETSAATLRLLFTDAGRERRQRVELSTTRYHGTGHWSAILGSLVTAPTDAWEEWEPVLSGIADSFRLDPQWNRGQQQANDAANRARLQDIHARQLQIGQTLRETSDIIVQGYNARQAVQDRLHHDFSNAILGRQDLTDSSGQVFNVSVGHDQYWRDNLNNVHGGSWLAQPDPSWQRLEPRG
jgi:hypothetical protein